MIEIAYFYFSIFLTCVAGILAIATPLMEPTWFISENRKRYVQIFRKSNIIIGPSITVFAILLLFWNLVLPLFNIIEYQAIPIIGSVYLYILMVHSIIDSPYIFSLAVFFSVNLIITMSIYSINYTTEHYIISGLLLTVFAVICWRFHLRKHTFKQNIQWYIWYAGTFGSTLR